MKKRHVNKKLILSFVSTAVMAFIIHIVLYKTVFTYVNVTHLFGLSFRIAFAELLLWFASSALLYGVSDKFDTLKKQNRKTVAAMILASVISVISIIYIAFSGLAFSDNGVTFKDDSSIMRICNVGNDEVQIYKVKGYYYKVPDAGSPFEGYYHPYKSDAYAVSDSEGHYFEFGELNKNSSAYEQLKQIEKNYNKKIIEIHSVRDLYLDKKEF